MLKIQTTALPLLALGLLLATAACGGNDEGDGAGGASAGKDGAGQVEDTGEIGGEDASVDAGSPGEDAGGADAGSSDTAAVEGDASDAGAPDAAEADAGPECPGGAGCDCAENDDCDTGACLDTADGKRCAATCTSDCPEGYDCKQWGASDVFYVCVPRHVSLCAPCKVNGDCKVQGSTSLCLDYGDMGHFCGGACKQDADCPGAYTCVEVFDEAAGKVFKQCKLKDPAAECTCSKWAVTTSFQTACASTNGAGSCKGTRSCTTAGLSACSAPAPAPELCDGADNDCDGQTDNLPAELTCTLKGWSDDGASGAPCKVDGDCKAEGEACDGGKCRVLIGACPGTPKCGEGGVLLCDGAATPEVEKCDGLDNDCDGSLDEGSCDDGDLCTKDACDAKAGKCSHEAAVDCDDNDQCTKDACDIKTGKCANTPFDGPCDDGDACTVGDACAGAAGGKATCESGKDKQQCDDANLCTDDACEPSKGCVNLPNAATKACFGADPKLEGVGECVGGQQICKGGALQGDCVGDVLPAVKEACNGKDDTCDGATDEGCKVVQADISFAAAFALAKGKQGQAWVEAGGSSPAGLAPGKKNVMQLGFMRWLASIW